MFTHHKLNVYQKALECACSAERLSSSWTRKHSFVDHFCRASESIVLNMAEGNGRYSELDHRRFLEVAAAAAVKSAAYLDLCEQKILPAGTDLSHGRELLGRITAMLSGF